MINRLSTKSKIQKINSQTFINAYMYIPIENYSINNLLDIESRVLNMNKYITERFLYLYDKDFYKRLNND